MAKNPFLFRAEPNAETLTPEQLCTHHLGRPPRVRDPFPTLESTYAHATPPEHGDPSPGPIAPPACETWQVGTDATGAREGGSEVGARPSLAPSTYPAALERTGGWSVERTGVSRLVATGIAYLKHNEFFVVTGLAGLILCYAVVIGPLAPRRTTSAALALGTPVLQRPIPDSVIGAPAPLASTILLGASTPALPATPATAEVRRIRTAPTPRSRAGAAAKTARAAAKTEASPTRAAPTADSETVESAKRELEAVSHELSATL